MRLRSLSIALFLGLAGCALPTTGDLTLVRRQSPGLRAPGSSVTETVTPTVFEQQPDRGASSARHEPRERRLQRAGSFTGDLRSLPNTPPRRRGDRPEREGPKPAPVEFPPDPAKPAPGDPIPPSTDDPVTMLAPAPATSANFDGLDRVDWGAGHPPDTTGDVGPNHYIQAINTSIGIYDKATSTRIAAFTFDTLMSQGNFGNICDTENFGDPVVLYDTFEDRWIISDFAFMLDGSRNVINPPGSFECFAVSQTGDPVTGGWHFYSINTTGGLGDYPKLGVWPDGLYMSVNMFDYSLTTGTFQNVRLYALNKAQMYAGAASVQVVEFNVPSGASQEFSFLPANARLQTGTPPAGSPNYFTSVWGFLNVVGVWKFHVDWTNVAASSLTGPFNSITGSNWSQLTSATVPSPANRLDTLYPRLIMQNQYTNIGGVESLWNTHTVGASGATSAQAAVRYYEVRVTGGTVSNARQAFTYSPDANHRFMPSTAVDRAGNMAFGYSVSNTALFPAIRYAGRLAADPVNQITQTETSLFAGTGSQSGNCGPSSCQRWGDYSTMTLDPDGCTFWYTSEYYQTTGLNYRTRVGAFAFTECTPVSAGTLQGTVRSSSALPIAGATVTLGSRTTTTDGSGNYSFADIASGTYPAATAGAAGHSSSTFTMIVVPSGGTATRDFVLTAAPQSGCMTDTAQADFQAGSSTNCDVTGTPGDVKLSGGAGLDQQAVFPVTGDGVVFDNTFWAGQTFVPSTSGTLMKVDVDLFCFTCSGTMPNITVSIRATNGTVPIGGDLATATIPGFISGSGGFFSAVFASPPTLTAGTRYAVIVRAASAPATGLYVSGCSCNPNTNPYANGRFVTSSNSGGTWTADGTAGGRDLAFKTYMQAGFTSSGTFVSSLKDANPIQGATPTWGTLSWNATTPAGTTVQFRAAASNNSNGPFTFVGPDGTAGTFFTSGASLAQFNGNRYLKYQAVLTTSNGSVTPALHDVTICFNNTQSATTTATLDSGSVTFPGKRLVGTTSAPAAPVTITNNGPGDLVFASFNGNAPAASFTVGTDFPATTNCPLTAPGLASGGSCQFTFSFSPTAAGPRNATLTIATNASNSPHVIALSGVGFVVNETTVAATVAAAGTRLQQLQNADGGWYFGATNTDCGSNAFMGGSCKNIIGVTGLGLLSAYDRSGDSTMLNDAIAAGELLEAIHASAPTQQPFSQDLEFLRALSAASSDPGYAALAQSWFATVTTVHPNAADRVAQQFANRGLVAVWDLASLIRSAKAADRPDYAQALGNEVVAREAEWRNVNANLTLLGIGSFLWAVHDLPGFDTTIADYRSQLLSQQDVSGTWSGGNLQTTAYAALGLGAVGGTGTAAAIQKTVEYYIANQLANGGWPFSIVDGVAGGEFSTVDSEIGRAIDLLFSTGSGSSVTVSPAQLAAVTFESVSSPGTTTVVATLNTSEAKLPSRYSLVPGLTYEVSTTATVSGSIVMCVSVPWDAIGNRFADVRLLQAKGGTRNARYEDVTILTGPFAPNASTKRVCGQLLSLAPVAVALRN